MNFFLTLLLILLLNTPNVFSKTWLHSDIEQFAQTYLEKNLQVPEEGRVIIKVATLDPRITIRPCQVPLKANIPENYQGRNLNIKIYCDDSTPWNIFLPVKVEITLPVLVAKNTILKGTILDNDNIEVQYIASNKIRGEKLQDKNIVLGAKAKKRISKGRSISRKSICLVCKGDTVTIIASSENFSIKTQGVALSSSNINEQIRIRNSRSNRVITATVKAINKVEINL
jgi:flagella basal body P-ring formation protein FlgA